MARENESKATPGPWFADIGWSVIGAERVIGIGPEADVVDCIVAEVPFDDDDPDENAWANAALIVRAVNSHDELVAALKEIIASSDAYEGNESDDERCHRALTAARSAVAKAEGCTL